MNSLLQIKNAHRRSEQRGQGVASRARGSLGLTEKHTLVPEVCKGETGLDRNGLASWAALTELEGPSDHSRCRGEAGGEGESSQELRDPWFGDDTPLGMGINCFSFLSSILFSLLSY